MNKSLPKLYTKIRKMQRGLAWPLHKSVKHSIIFLRGKKIYFIILCVRVSVWACVHDGECPGRPEESTGSFEARVTGDCEQFNVGAGKLQSSVKVASALMTKSSL